jgi:hypothetical protein
MQLVPQRFHDFFIASTGAGAALVGLLFVAVSVVPARTLTHALPLEGEMVAASAFTALVNAFFVSLIVLMPGVNLGAVAVMIGVLAFVANVLLGRWLLKLRRTLKLRPLQLIPCR